MPDRPMYHHGMRPPQDHRERCWMAFMTTEVADEVPDCFHQEGLPGFVQVPGERTLPIPDYDRNGTYRSHGKVLMNPRMGLLFLDFGLQKRLRVIGMGRVLAEGPELEELHGAKLAVCIRLGEAGYPGAHP